MSIRRLAPLLCATCLCAVSAQAEDKRHADAHEHGHGSLDIAVEGKLREAMKAGSLQPLKTKDLLNAAGQVKPSTREWFASARNYALYSNQGGVYDDILNYLKLK